MLRDVSTYEPTHPHPSEFMLMTTLTTDNTDDTAHRDIPTEDPLDDVFGSGPPSPSTPTTGGAHIAQAFSQSTHPSDIPRLRSVHVTNGYREGLASSKEKFIQDGFDEGFALGSEIGLRAGAVIGVLEGLCVALAKGVRQGADEGGGTQVVLEKVLTVLERARSELSLEVLLGESYFGADGTIKYEMFVLDGDAVAERRGEDAVVPAADDVAAKHPVLRQWTTEIESIALELGLHIGLNEGF